MFICKYFERRYIMNSQKEVSVSFVRPIDPKDGYNPEHFEYIEKKLSKEIEDIENSSYSFVCNGLVSDSTGVSSITRTIIKKIFNADIVIVDISTLNPNVMFELGLRLSLPKMTIIIKDDETTLPFDIKDFYILSYPHSLSGIDLDKFVSDFKVRFVKTWTDFNTTDGENTFIHSFYGSNLISPEINTQNLNEAIDKLGNMIDLMQHKYIAYDPRDRWDSFDFEHDVSSPVPLD